MPKTKTTVKTEKKAHPGWGGARANSGGPREAGPGKRIGRPRKSEQVMTRLDVRIPPEWRKAIEAKGGGSFSDGIRKIIQESGVVG